MWDCELILSLELKYERKWAPLENLMEVHLPIIYMIFHQIVAHERYLFAIYTIAIYTLLLL